MWNRTRHHIIVQTTLATVLATAGIATAVPVPAASAHTVSCRTSRVVVAHSDRNILFSKAVKKSASRGGRYASAHWATCD